MIIHLLKYTYFRKARKVYGLKKERQKESHGSIREANMHNSGLLSNDPFLETYLEVSKQNQFPPQMNLSLGSNTSATDIHLVPISPLLLRLAILYEPQSHNVSINITALNSSNPLHDRNVMMNPKMQAILTYLSFRSRNLSKNGTVDNSELLQSPPVNTSLNATNTCKNIEKEVKQLSIIGLNKLILRSSIRSDSNSNGLQNRNTSALHIFGNSAFKANHSINSKRYHGVEYMIGSKDFSLMSVVCISTAALFLTVLLQLFFIPHLCKRIKTVRTQCKVGSSNNSSFRPMESAVILDQAYNVSCSDVHSEELQTPLLRTNSSTQSDLIEPVIVFNKRERRPSSKGALNYLIESQLPQQNQSVEPADENPQLWTIYPQSTPEEVDNVNNPYRFSVSAIKREPVQNHRNNSLSSGGEDSTVVGGYFSSDRTSEGSGETDGLLAVYEEQVFFVEDNPLENRNSSLNSMKKILFPSFVYSNNLSNHMDGEAEIFSSNTSLSEHPQPTLATSLHTMDNSLSISTAEPYLVTAGSPSDWGATTTATLRQDTPQSTKVLSRQKKPSFGSNIHQGIVDTPLIDSKHQCDIGRSDENTADSSDEEYGTSIHSFSFSTATFSPYPSVSRSILHRTNSCISQSNSLDSDNNRVFITPKSASSFDSQMMMATSSNDRGITRSSSTHSSGDNSFATTHTTYNQNKNSVKRTDSFFVRPKTAASLDELTTEQIIALNKQFSRSNDSNNGIFVDNSKISTYSIDCDDNSGNSVSHRLIHKDRNHTASSERKSNGSSRHTSSATMSEFASCASDISGCGNSTTSLAAPATNAGNIINNDNIQCNRQMSQLSNVSGLSNSSHGISYLSNFNHSKSQSVTTAATVKVKDKKTAHNVSFKSSSVDSHPPRNSATNDQAKKQSRFFRCISPCSAVNYFVRSPEQQNKSRQLSAGTPANSTPKSYSSIHSNRIPMKSSSSTTITKTASNSSMSNSSLRSSTGEKAAVSKLNSPSKHNLFQPGSSVVRNKQQQDSAILSSLKAATKSSPSSSSSIPSATVANGADASSRASLKHSRGIYTQ